MADVDHVIPVGALEGIDDLSAWTRKMFFNEQRAICKICHKIKTKEDMKAMRKAK